MKRLETEIRFRLEEALQDLALTPGQYTTMSVVHSGPQSSASLARRVGVTPQSMSEVIATLERNGLVVKSPREDNRRIADIALTGPGKALLGEAERRVDALEHRLMHNLPDDGERDLRRLLELMLS